MKKVLIIAILAIGLFLRLHNLDKPIADWHSHRQADTAAVTQIFAQKGLDFFHPRYQDISSTQSGKENPQGYRMVEAPIYNTLSLGLHYLTGQSVEISSRLVSIILSLGSGYLIYLIIFQATSQFLPSLLGMTVFMFLPFSIYYSRTILPEPTAVFFMLLSLYLFSKNLLLSAITLATSILIKPYTAIILFPTFLVLIYQSKKNLLQLALFGLISLAPFIAWRIWIGQFPEGIPSSNWLLNNGVTTTFPVWYHGYNLSFLNKLVAFRPHWWTWLFQERISDLILGSFGVIPAFLGLAYQKKYSQPFAISLVIGIFLYFVIIAQGNIQHDYYQTLIIPSLSIISGIGYYYIYRLMFNSYIVKLIALAFIFGISTFFSYKKVGSYYQINNPNIISAGQKAKVMLPTNSLVIAPYNGDTTLLYQTGFAGWPNEVYDLEAQVQKFKDRPIYLVSVNYDKYTNDLVGKYPTIIKDNSYIILKISP